jgi:hypothetical protein
MVTSERAGDMTETSDVPVKKTAPSEETPKKETKVKAEDRLTKRDLMDLIEGVISKSRIRTAKLWNPYDDIVGDSAFKAKISAKSSGDGPPDLIPDVAFKNLSTIQLRSWGLEVRDTSGGTTVTEDVFLGERDRRRVSYVQWGAKWLKIFTSGNCSIFASVTLALLASDDVLTQLPSGIVIEQMNFASSDGHAFLVVNRSGGKTNEKGQLCDPTSWGPDAFVVDAWYANQLQTSPGKNAVKNITGKSGDAYYDETFLNFLHQYAIRTPTAFSYPFLAKVTK